MTPLAKARADLDALARQTLNMDLKAAKRKQMDTGHRARTPGYQEYAERAREDVRKVLPSGPEAASMSNIPFLSEAGDAVLATDAFMHGRVGEGALGMLAMGLPGVSLGMLKQIDPQRSFRALRRFATRPGELFPAMIQGKGVAGTPAIKRGEEIHQEFHPEKAEAKPIAARMGWHHGSLPYAEQFDVKVRPADLAYLRWTPEELARQGGKKPEDLIGKKVIQPDSLVWSEVEIPAGRDYTDLVATMERQGLKVGERLSKAQERLAPGEERLWFAPSAGSYRYDPSNSAKRGDDPWVISDRTKHVRLVSDEEVDEILRSMGREDLVGHKRRGGGWSEKQLREMFPSWFE